MSKNKKESFFWTSYSDLMTSLFFVMLVLFVLVIVLLYNRMIDLEKQRKEIEQLMVKIEQEKNANEQQLNKIKEIETSIKNIDSNYFEYNSEFKRHTLKNINVSFRDKSAKINDIPNDQRKRLLEAGRSIQNFMQQAVDSIPDIKYLLIVEGQSSKDDFTRNYELSYERALALVKFWKENGLNFNDTNCEIIISGSGTESLFRVKPEIINNRGNPANQRFVIHIIPKPGIIEANQK